MRLERLLNDLNLSQWLQSLLPDFVLAFAFFTSLTFAVLGKRFEHQRSSIAMSVSIGFALSIGLVWWEQANNLSIKNLGPIAIGFAVLVLSFIMYNSIKQIGGSWAGVGITIGACILIAKVLKLNIPIDSDIIQTITVTALIVGIFAFLMHTSSRSVRLPTQTLKEMYPDRCYAPVMGMNMYNLLHQSKLTFNMHADLAGGVGNMRLFEATGVGVCLLTDTGNNMVDLFEADKEVVTYSNIDEAVEKVKYLMGHKEEAAEIAMAGQKRTLKDHTIKARCQQIDELIQASL